MKGTTPLLYRLQFSASTERRLRPHDLQATTWRKLPLHSFLASIGTRLQPEGSFHFLFFLLQSKRGYNLLSLPHPATPIRRILLNLWTCHTQNPAADILCTVYCQVSLITDADTLCTTLYIYHVPISESASAYRSLSCTITEVSLLCYCWTSS